MAVQARYVQEGSAVDHTPAADVSTGTVIVVGDRVGIAKGDMAANRLDAIATCGVFDFVKANVVIADGDDLFWDADGDPVGGVAGSGAVTTAAEGNVYIGKAVRAALAAAATVRGHLQQPVPVESSGLSSVIADPGDAGAIAVANTGSVALVTAGAETRTLAAPAAIGQTVQLYLKTDGGNCVVTTATTVNQNGDNTLTFAEVGDSIVLVGKESDASLVWSVLSNDGVDLTTV